MTPSPSGQKLIKFGLKCPKSLKIYFVLKQVKYYYSLINLAYLKKMDFPKTMVQIKTIFCILVISFDPVNRFSKFINQNTPNIKVPYLFYKLGIYSTTSSRSIWVPTFDPCMLHLLLNLSPSLNSY